MGDIGGGDASGAAMAAPPLPASDDPDPSSSSISPENWAVAQEIIQQVVNGVHPTLDSEERRNNVIDYVQRLLKTSLGMEVFAYGSVPLKTYLPDGDIDLTILSSYPEGSWAADVFSVLQREGLDENAEYEVRDTQFIDAEVKLVKCLVQNIVIDISFNQFGGLCTLCFLEQVDWLVGKDHLFKRGIIFIKAWCYYESRILGAHHGLLSTYALETLVLYIFHLFHSSLDGPLAVLYKFLDYFSKFDWDNYCISLNGPVRKSSLPEIVVDMPQQEWNQQMLSEEFLRNCTEMFSIPSIGQEINPRVFTLKHMNIIDPLKDYNNLGRSVHRGNFYRIRSAFRYGARKLGRILSLPKDKIADEIWNFFSNTLQRSERKYGSSIQDYDLLIGEEGSRTILSSSDAVVCTEDPMFLRSSSANFNNDGLFVGEKYASVQSEIYTARGASSQTLSDPSYSVNETPVSGYRLKGNDCDLVTRSYFDYSPSSNLSVSSFGQYYHVPQLYLPKPNVKNDPFNQVDASDGLEEKVGVDSWLEQRESNIEMGYISQSCSDSLDGFCPCSSDVSSPKTNISENLLLSFRERDFSSLVDTEPLNPLADLSGDYDSHIRSLLHGPFFHKLALSSPVRPNPPVPISHVQNMAPWHTVRQSMPLNWSSFSQMNASTTFVGQPESSLGPSISGFSSEERRKVRGTGTYIPIMNNSGRDGLSRGWDWAPGSHGQYQKHLGGNGRVPVFSEACTSAKGGQERFQAWSPVQVHEKSGSSSQSQGSKGCNTRANGYSDSLERIEFGSIGRLVDELMSAPSSTSCALASNNQMSASSHLERPEQRVGDQPFGLENEEDFPRLSI